MVVSFSFIRFGDEQSMSEISSRGYMLKVSLEVEVREIGLKLGPTSLSLSYKVYGRRKKLI